MPQSKVLSATSSFQNNYLKLEVVNNDETDTASYLFSVSHYRSK